MKEQRDRGLCYNCNENWGLRHKYKVDRLFIMEYNYSNDDEDVKCGKTIRADEDKGSKDAVEQKLLKLNQKYPYMH